MDRGENEPEDRHRGESNLSVDQEEQEYVNMVPEDNALGDGIPQNGKGLESAYVDQPDNNSKQVGSDSSAAKSDDEDSNFGGGGVGRPLTLGGYADDEDHVAY